MGTSSLDFLFPLASRPLLRCHPKCPPSPLCYHGNVEHHSFPKFPQISHMTVLPLEVKRLPYNAAQPRGNLLEDQAWITSGLVPVCSTCELRRKGFYIFKRLKKLKEECFSATSEDDMEFQFQCPQGFVGMQAHTSLLSTCLLLYKRPGSDSWVSRKYSLSGLA